MKIVLFGSTDLTLLVANFLYDNSYEISAIVTIPPVFNISYKQEGVINSRFVDMHAWGVVKNIKTFDYENVSQIIDKISNIKVDFAIVIGWYHMVPKKLRDLFPIGCAGFHASLLPQLRGGAPLNWAILHGFKETGVSFFELSDGVDDGLLYAQESFIIKPSDYISDLIEKSEKKIIKILKENLSCIKENNFMKYQQVGIPSYCGQRIPEDSQINWNKSAEDILKLIKASSKPYAGAYSFLKKEKVIVWKAELSRIEVYGAPGQILIIDGKIHVVCKDGALMISDYQSAISLEKSNHMRIN